MEKRQLVWTYVEQPYSSPNYIQMRRRMKRPSAPKSLLVAALSLSGKKENEIPELLPLLRKEFALALARMNSWRTTFNCFDNKTGCTYNKATLSHPACTGCTWSGLSKKDLTRYKARVPMAMYLRIAISGGLDGPEARRKFLGFDKLEALIENLSREDV